jgi:oligopeptide/dipeptide ABC transporter ATP-binding protein
MMQAHERVSKKQALARAGELLDRVGIDKRRIRAYPHELSGGMRQRVMIAMALSCEPSVLIADEPTTALDVTIQAQILELLRRLQSELRMSVLLITHDLGVVAEYTSHVIVMYAGKVVESASAIELFEHPRHPYTRGLLESIPKVPRDEGAKKRLPVIAGMVPDLRHLPNGCRFADRCPLVIEKCTQAEPELFAVGTSGRLSRCYRADEV